MGLLDQFLQWADSQEKGDELDGSQGGSPEQGTDDGLDEGLDGTPDGFCGVAAGASAGELHEQEAAISAVEGAVGRAADAVAGTQEALPTASATPACSATRASAAQPGALEGVGAGAEAGIGPSRSEVPSPMPLRAGGSPRMVSDSGEQLCGACSHPSRSLARRCSSGGVPLGAIPASECGLADAATQVQTRRAPHGLIRGHGAAVAAVPEATCSDGEDMLVCGTGAVPSGSEVDSPLTVVTGPRSRSDSCASEDSMPPFPDSWAPVAAEAGHAEVPGMLAGAIAGVARAPLDEENEEADDEELEELYEVIGGTSSGGILVRDGQCLSSPVLSERLRTGALVKVVERQGSRVQYELAAGQGPPAGWVTTSLHGKAVVIRTSRRPRVPAGTEVSKADAAASTSLNSVASHAAPEVLAVVANTALNAAAACEEAEAAATAVSPAPEATATQAPEAAANETGAVLDVPAHETPGAAGVEATAGLVVVAACEVPAATTANVSPTMTLMTDVDTQEAPESVMEDCVAAGPVPEAGNGTLVEAAEISGMAQRVACADEEQWTLYEADGTRAYYNDWTGEMKFELPKGCLCTSECKQQETSQVAPDPGVTYQVTTTRQIPIMRKPSMQASILNQKEPLIVGDTLELFEWDTTRRWRRCESQLTLRLKYTGWVRLVDEDDSKPSMLPLGAKLQEIQVSDDICAEGGPLDPVLVAVYEDNLRHLTDFIEAGVDVNVRSRSRHTPISLAVHYGRMDCAVLLLWAGADVPTHGLAELGITPARRALLGALAGNEEADMQSFGPAYAELRPVAREAADKVLARLAAARTARLEHERELECERRRQEELERRRREEAAAEEARHQAEEQRRQVEEEERERRLHEEFAATAARLRAVEAERKQAEMQQRMKVAWAAWDFEWSKVQELEQGHLSTRVVQETRDGMSLSEDEDAGEDDRQEVVAHLAQEEVELRRVQQELEAEARRQREAAKRRQEERWEEARQREEEVRRRIEEEERELQTAKAQGQCWTCDECSGGSPNSRPTCYFCGTPRAQGRSAMQWAGWEHQASTITA